MLMNDLDYMYALFRLVSKGHVGPADAIRAQVVLRNMEADSRPDCIGQTSSTILSEGLLSPTLQLFIMREPHDKLVSSHV